MAGSVFVEKRRRKPLLLPDGTEVAQFSYRLKWEDPNIRDEFGQMIQQSITFDDEDKARKFAVILKAANLSLPNATALARSLQDKVLTVAEMVCEHVSLLTGIEEQTRADYRRMAGYHIIPVIGSLPGDTIERDQVRKWVNQVSVPDPERTGAILTRHRKDAGLSREQLAARLDWPAKKIVGYETGNQPLDNEDLAAASKALKVSRVDRVVLATISSGMGAKTLRNVHALLSAAFTWAITERKLRVDNPAKNIKLPDYTPAEMTFLTPAELGLLLLKFEEPYQLMVRFLAGTGVRWGELIALTVGDIHLDVADPYVSINKAVKRKPGGHYVGAPKSTRSRRLVSLPPSLVEPLRLVVGDRNDGDPLFLGPRGGRVHYSNFYNDHWVPAFKAVTATRFADGSPVPRACRLTKSRLRIHDLRHTHASGLIAQGVDLATVQRRLGHESITTTVDRYGHLDPRQLQDAARAADAMLAVAGAPIDPLPDVLVPVVDLDAERRARAGAGGDTEGEPATDGRRAVPAEATTFTLSAATDDVDEDRARKILGEELKRVRTLRGWSQAALIARLPFSLHIRTYAGYELGNVALTTTRFIQLCQVMRVPAAQVMERAMARLGALPPGDIDTVDPDPAALDDDMVSGDDVDREEAV